MFDNPYIVFLCAKVSYDHRFRWLFLRSTTLLRKALVESQADTQLSYRSVRKLSFFSKVRVFDGPFLPFSMSANEYRLYRLVAFFKLYNIAIGRFHPDDGPGS